MKGNHALEALAALCGDASADDGNRSGGNSGDSVTMSSLASTQSQSAHDAVRQSGQLHASLVNQQSPLQNVSSQQWQQVIAAAAALQGSGVNPLAAQSLLASAGLPSQSINDNALQRMKQLAYHQQFVQAQANLSAHQAAQTLSAGKSAFGDQANHQALLMALTGGKANSLASVQELLQGGHQVIPSGANITNASNRQQAPSTTASAMNSSPVLKSMQPPPPPSQGVLSTPSTAGLQLLGQAQVPSKIAPMPGGKVLPNIEGSASASSSTGGRTGGRDDKKQVKRAANRRSAQLSRKRKKQFIEELKEENDELRRKEQILRSIPDLIVVFDSSGKLGFVSQSVSRFLDMTPEELEGTSFWNRLCEDSVRLLKAAFMDSLAARRSDSDTAPLGSGVWELRLIDKQSNYIVVTLNGVVHFSGESPECVCCIRPRDQKPIRKLSKEMNKSAARPVSSSDCSRSSDGCVPDQLQIRANPNQSVISNDNDTSADDSGTNSGSRKKPRRKEADARSSSGEIVRISDGDSVGISSGSDDGIASN